MGLDFLPMPSRQALVYLFKVLIATTDEETVAINQQSVTRRLAGRCGLPLCRSGKDMFSTSQGLEVVVRCLEV